MSRIHLGQRFASAGHKPLPAAWLLCVWCRPKNGKDTSEKKRTCEQHLRDNIHNITFGYIWKIIGTQDPSQKIKTLWFGQDLECQKDTSKPATFIKPLDFASPQAIYSWGFGNAICGFDRCRIVVNWISLWRQHSCLEKNLHLSMSLLTVLGTSNIDFFQEDHRKKTEKDFSALPFLDLAPSKDMPVVQWKKPGCLGFVKGIILPSYVGTMKKAWTRSLFNNQDSMERNASRCQLAPLKKGKNRGPKHPGSAPRFWASIGSKDS